MTQRGWAAGFAVAALVGIGGASLAGTTSIEPGVNPATAEAVPLIAGRDAAGVADLGRLGGDDAAVRKLLDNPPGSPEARGAALRLADDLAARLLAGPLPPLTPPQARRLRLAVAGLIAAGRQDDPQCCARLGELLGLLGDGAE